MVACFCNLNSPILIELALSLSKFKPVQAVYYNERIFFLNYVG